MKFSSIRFKSLIFAAFICFGQQVVACTDILITAQDGTILDSRTMEFAQEFNSNLRATPRGKAYTTVAPDGKPGIGWTAKYGTVYLDGFGVDMAVDGMNEHGLAFGELYMPGLAKYQTVPAGKNSEALPYYLFGNWALGNFKTVDDVRAALYSVYVFEQKMAGQGDMIFPLHFAFHDATGKSLVVEYINGEMHIYDNPIGVLTNSPSFDWHLTNLNNYVALKPTNPQPVIFNGVTFSATGQGSGMLGLPGDISPPSRFVKMSALLATVSPVADAAGALALAQHVIYNVDIPKGLAREGTTGNYTNEYTQWAVFKDLTNKTFSYHTYDDTTIHYVDLNQVDFNEKAAELAMPIASKQSSIDMTADLLKSKAN